MTHYVILAESQLIGGHAEYYVLCGPGVPSLGSLWGAIQNRQLYILRMYCKGCISFNFSIFFLKFTPLTAKKNYAPLPQKQKKFNFFFIIYTTYRKKKMHAFTAKKITRLDDFFVHDLHFSRLMIISFTWKSHKC